MQICETYYQMTTHSLEEAIDKEFCGHIRDGLKAILQCSIDRTEFFASRLHKSMKGLGTNDQQLIRLIVSRSEIDLSDIKLTFERLYGKSLRSWIKVGYCAIDEFYCQKSKNEIELCVHFQGDTSVGVSSCWILEYNLYFIYKASWNEIIS